VQASGIDPTGDTGVANSGLIVGAAGAVAVDALMVPTMTRKLVAAIKKTTTKPIAQLVNTHHHLDHTGGNRFFAGATIDRAPSVARRSRPAFRRCLCYRRSCRASPRVPEAEGGPAHRDVRGPHGPARRRPRDPALASGIRRPHRRRRGGLPAEERVLFAGDIAFHYVTPLAFQGHVGNWIKAADRLLRFDADVIVPGHGPSAPRPTSSACATTSRWCGARRSTGSTQECPRRRPRADIKLGVFASWSDAERILPNVMRCYQEFRNELDQPMDLPRMLAGMERLRGARADHACL
jgi:cyclase